MIDSNRVEQHCGEKSEISSLFLLSPPRWILSSRRPLTWTIWPSCMKVGPPGCEGPPVHRVCGPALDWRSHQVPEGRRRSKDATQPIRGLETGAAADSALPKLLGSHKGAVVDLVALATAATLTNHLLLGNTTLRGPATPPPSGRRRVQPGQSRAEGGRVSEALKTPPPPRQHLLLLGLL